MRPLDGQAEADVELLGRPRSSSRGAADVGATGAFEPVHEVAGESCRKLVSRPRLQDLREVAVDHHLTPAPRPASHGRPHTDTWIPSKLEIAGSLFLWRPSSALY